MWSRRCEYAIQATLFLAASGRDGYVTIREIGSKLGVSYQYLTKVLQDLSEIGMIRSARGPNGGVLFIKPPEKISLKDILVAIDGPQLFEKCVLGIAACNDDTPCPMHAAWSEVMKCVDETLSRTTIADLASDTQAFSNLLARIEQYTSPSYTCTSI